MPYAHWKMRCHTPTCRKTIELPVPTREQLHANPGEWPRRTWSTSFLCLWCGHVDTYSASRKDVQVYLLPQEPPYRLRGYQAWSIRFLCGEQNCDTLVETYTTADGSITKDAILDRIYQFGVHSDCSSGKGHKWTLPPQRDRVQVEVCVFPW
jgi:hypothetical protein